jgi:hypothetical protein
MRPIFLAMLCVQVALVLVVAFTVLTAKPKPGRPRPVWSSLAISLIIAGGASFHIADRHSADPLSRLLEYGSALLLGMGLMSMLILLRQRLGRDTAA